MIGALGTTLCFALTAVFANRAALQLGSTLANLYRLLLAAVILGVWAHVAGLGFGGAFGWFFVSGLAGFGLGGVAMFQSLPLLGSALSMLIVQCGTVVVAAGVEWLWLGTKLTPIQIACASATVVGVALGLMPRSLPAVPGAALRRGVAWAVVSAIGQGVGAVLSRKAFAAAAAIHVRPDAATTAYQRALGGLVVAAIAVALMRGARREKSVATLGETWPWVAANVLTGPVLGVTCYQWALSTTPAGIVQPIVATSPLVTIPLAAAVERTWPRPLYYLGAVLAVAGVAGLYLAR
ncbi:MAG: DMT family transporter [Verrucomicrobia bacterium]|nr:DMT family transporter [Verrucomicrobiota bacterium]